MEMITKLVMGQNGDDHRFFNRGVEKYDHNTELTNCDICICSSGPLLALALAREDAVLGWRDALGPKEVPVAKEQAPHR